MRMISNIRIDPALDLVLERTVDVAPELVWKAWTTPEHLMPWFCPRPWTTVDCEIDLRPGGVFRTTMQSPEGQQFPSSGCYLEVVQNRKLVFTSALGPGYRPIPIKAGSDGDFLFTAVILIEPSGAGTKYTAIAIHSNPDDARKHEAMGFSTGWGTALDQLVEYVKTWKS